MCLALPFACIQTGILFFFFNADFVSRNKEPNSKNCVIFWVFVFVFFFFSFQDKNKGERNLSW